MSFIRTTYKDGVVTTEASLNGERWFPLSGPATVGPDFCLIWKVRDAQAMEQIGPPYEIREYPETPMTQEAVDRVISRLRIGDPLKTTLTSRLPGAD